MNLKTLSDSELLSQTDKTVAQERELTGLVLEHLREIEARRLFARLSFSSLFEYCVKHLKYCPASAQLRIDAMRLSKEVPEVQEKLNSGSVSLSSVGTLQKFFRAEKTLNEKSYTPDEKKSFLDQIENKSKDETEKLLREISPHALPQEKERILTSTETEIRFVADPELQDLLRQMKEKLGNPGISYQELLKKTLKKALGIPKTTRPPTSSEEAAMHQDRDGSEKREYLSVSLKREVAERAGHQCTYVSPITARRCIQKHGLQIEHRIPWAQGGTSELSNLTLLCPAHNRLRAVEVYGAEKMKPYLRV